MDEYSGLDAVALAELVRSRKVKPIEILEAAIARAEAVNPTVNAIVNKLYDHARSAIKGGLPKGPLSGVPFLLKDLHAFCTGAATTYGCRFFRDNIVDHDSELVRRYKQAGLVIFGKTNTPEFGLNVSTEPVLFGPTRNPWNREHSAGGSSGGAAAAVAAGIVPVAHASDGGGSIRIPAACCGLFGLKPTRGRNPHGPDRGEGWAGMSTEHVISRSVRDSATLLDATCGPDSGAPYWAAPPAAPYAKEVGKRPGRLRVVFVTGMASGEPIDTECKSAVVDAAKLMEKLSHDVEEQKPEFVREEFGPAFRTIIAGNTRATVDNYAAKIKREARPEDFEKATWLYLEAGAKQSAADYARAVTAIHRAGRQIAAFFDDVDLLITPTLARLPQKLGYFDMMSEDTAELTRRVGLFTAFTALFNVAGNPAMSVPLAQSKSGLPIGVQFVGRYGAEATLLRVAGQLERARPWADLRPAL